MTCPLALVEVLEIERQLTAVIKRPAACDRIGPPKSTDRISFFTRFALACSPLIGSPGDDIATSLTAPVPGW
jgi:hypothetical protein